MTNSTGNLIVNGNAETGTLAPNYTTTDTPPGWTTTGAFTELAYSSGSAQGDMGPTQSAAINGGNGFFAGGNLSTLSTAYQTIDVSSYATLIDAGKFNYAASGDFGGWENQDDAMNMVVTFYAADDSTVLGSTTIDGPLAAARNDITEFLYEENDGAVPAGTRFIKVELDAVRTSGSYNDGYADNVSLTLNSTSLINGAIIVTATTNYTADQIASAPSITFQTSAASTATFDAAQFGGIGGGGISSTATITGDSNADTMQINLDSSHSFNGSGLTFQNWSATNDSFRITGTSTGGDTITGTSTNDTILETTGSGNTINSGAGNDYIKLGGNFDSSMSVNGGSGSNTIQLNGDYSSYLTITSAMLQNVDKVLLAAGHNYNLTIHSGVVAAGQTMTIDGSKLGANDLMGIDVTQDPSGQYVIYGGAGQAVITLNNQVDTVYAGSGPTGIYTYAEISSHDKFVGGGDTFLDLSGDYSAGFTFKASTFSNLQSIILTSGDGYNLTTNDANVAAGQTMTINGGNLGVADSFSFNGSHETDGNFYILAGAGVDKLTGGAGNDTFSFTTPDIMTAADHINGGGGNNELQLDGDYSAGLKFGGSTIQNIQDINLTGGESYKLTTADANVAAGQTLTVDGSSLYSTDTLNFNGAKETDGNFSILGGAGNDTLTGGAGNDSFNGGGGADILTGNGGADTFYYDSVSDSTSTAHDTIVGFDALTDHIGLQNLLALPNAIDTAVTIGKLTSTNFDVDLTKYVGASQLRANDAVLFTPNSGGLSGHTYLVIDENGIAGYQAGQDLVIEVTGATNLANLNTTNFT